LVIFKIEEVNERQILKSLAEVEYPRNIKEEILSILMLKMKGSN